MINFKVRKHYDLYVIITEDAGFTMTFSIVENISTPECPSIYLYSPGGYKCSMIGATATSLMDQFTELGGVLS
jgi:hypothetical protein